MQSFIVMNTTDVKLVWCWDNSVILINIFISYSEANFYVFEKVNRMQVEHEVAEQN